MTYWFTDPQFKNLMPLAGAKAIRGLSTTFSVPTIVMGANALPEGPGLGQTLIDRLALRCERRRAFIVTDENGVNYAARVARALEKGRFTTETWSRILPEPPVENVKECAESMRQFEPDMIVAIGGGSVMDGAKVAWILYERPDITNLATLSPIRPLGLRKKAFLVAFPTTSGTGSECTQVAVVSDVAAKRKLPILSPELMPDFAILVPDFAMGMPPKLTAGTGLDALAHAMDNVASYPSIEICDALALKAIEMIFKYLPRAYRYPRDREARLRMHIAATMAGIAFSQGGIAVTHSLGHAVGKLFSVHHGIAVGILIPYAYQFYAPISDKYLAVCKALDVDGTSPEKKLDALLTRVRGLLAELDVPTDFKGLGIPREEFEANFDTLALSSFEDPSNFQSVRPPTLEQCKKLLWCAYEGKDVDF
jgi:alcohol dehydrogenase class IV